MSFTGVANTDLNSMLKTEDVNNYARLSDSELDSLLDEAMYTTDEAKSTELYKTVRLRKMIYCHIQHYMETRISTYITSVLRI